MSFKKIKNLIKNINNTNPYSVIIKDYKNILVPEELYKLDNICLEIGCGSGKFLSSYANNKDNNYLGIDLRFKRLIAAAIKSDKRNLFWSRVDANSLFDFLKKPSIKELHIYFPDPWPKKRHAKKRLVQGSFLEKIKKYMLPNARIFFKTDHDEYFKMALESLSKCFEIVKVSEDLYKEVEFNSVEATEFEHLFYKKNKNINFVEALYRESSDN